MLAVEATEVFEGGAVDFFAVFFAAGLRVAAVDGAVGEVSAGALVPELVAVAALLAVAVFFTAAFFLLPVGVGTTGSGFLLVLALVFAISVQMLSGLHHTGAYD